MAGAADAFKLAVVTAIGQQGALISLHSGDPGVTGANEITGGNYARKTTTWGEASIISGGDNDGKARIVGSTLQFNVPGGTAVNYYSVRKSDGTFLYSRPLTPGATLNGDGVIDVTPEHIYDLTD
ncbi:hypothetical protein SEA_LILPHARAOH_25 [Mycobacterium phage LilPharaoh]|uniref:Minor tail protein n=1 Tax=Mycobacterium phage Amelie TaxID=1913035 RepID=A0A1J0GRC8_9CAUD|nr:hypothetical protein AVV01_gp25 [Mycobacterium phage Enkosi]YP_009952543.1 hypothetical protein I5G92_gp25 [Mycobacterium phage Amelie]ATN90478.1 hypothetical protein SEA_LILPHARAOH_25 [Mycobacterium phage LilPharaoh]AVP42602.1 hypothetical protein SEA_SGTBEANSPROUT_25 [Mycobacterium phage SgtBeansprout]AXC37131.1 hypothetical protein SEA_BIGLEBOPS_25 [Mycobacterium phage Biglebops]QGJ93310.1 hypothetical protein PBI_MDAVU_25 [Mycobacterium phage Mdavu]UQS94426.1 hypothetical protein SEA_N